MKNINSILLIAFLLSSCAPAVIALPTFTPQPTETLTPSPTATQTPSPTPTITPTPTPIGGGSGKFIFEYYKAAYEKEFPDLKGEMHVFISNWDGSNLIPITSGLNNLNQIQSISANGQLVLVSSRSSYLGKADLYLINLSSADHVATKLANGLDVGWQAIFLDNTRIVYIGRGSQGYGFYIVNVDGTGAKRIGAPTGRVWWLASSDKSRVYWYSITRQYPYGDSATLWWTNLDGSGQGKLESNRHPISPAGFGEGAAFSPDGTKIAWIPNGLEPDCPYLYLAFWTPDIRNGAYTELVTRYANSEYKDSPHVGKVIDTAYVEDHVRHCFLLHVAPLSDLDNDTKIPLIPPFDPDKANFYYHRDYAPRWWPDGSKILAYDTGFAMKRWSKRTGHYPLALYEVSPEDTHPRLELLTGLSNSPIVQPGVDAMPRLVDSYTSFRFSPDGRQILFTKYNYGNQGSMIGTLTLDAMNYVDDFGHNITPDFQIKRVGDIYWLP